MVPKEKFYQTHRWCHGGSWPLEVSWCGWGGWRCLWSPFLDEEALGPTFDGLMDLVPSKVMMWSLMTWWRLGTFDEDLDARVALVGVMEPLEIDIMHEKVCHPHKCRHDDPWTLYDHWWCIWKWFGSWNPYIWWIVSPWLLEPLIWWNTCSWFSHHLVMDSMWWDWIPWKVSDLKITWYLWKGPNWNPYMWCLGYWTHTLGSLLMLMYGPLWVYITIGM